jgi:hypothetical protein
MNRRTGTFEEFKDYTLAVVRGERRVDPSEPKIWRERIAADERGEESEKFASFDAENSHYVVSSLRERIVEHVFVGEALRKLWQLKVRDVEVLRSEVDAGGYDLVMSYRKIVRHIQFKSILEGGKAASVNVSLKLMEKPSGCVIWMVVSPKELDLKSYRWFGGSPGQPLPNISELKPAKHTKGNAQGIKLQKPNHRVVPLRFFEKLDTLDAVLNRLFGPLP